MAAARKSRRPGRVVSYLVTVAGPEPLDALQHAPDREHYVDKQVRPVAEPVLAALGLDFDRVVGRRRSVDPVLTRPRREPDDRATESASSRFKC